MRNEEYFLGDFERGGTLDESDFRQGLSLVTEPGNLPQVQQYDALQGLVHWGLKGKRPDLALEAYEAYVIHGWTWQAQVIRSQKAEGTRLHDEYSEARDKKEEDTGESHAGMQYFTLSQLELNGVMEGRAREDEKEGEAFRNDVLPRILSGLLDEGRSGEVYGFLTGRREIHGFRGYPRELDPAECIDIHCETAQAVLDPISDFEGDREQAFRDLATFSLEYAQFPQFGSVNYVPRLAPIQKEMVERGMENPWDVFLSGIEHAVRRFNEGTFAVDAIFNGLRRYLKEAETDELEQFLARDWPEYARESFDLAERNTSIPSGLAWLLPAIKNGVVTSSASDSMQSAPVLGNKLIQARLGNEDAFDEIFGGDEEAQTPALESGPLTTADALKMVTNTR
jgi:hypothetical protein